MNLIFSCFDRIQVSKIQKSFNKLIYIAIFIANTLINIFITLYLQYRPIPKKGYYFNKWNSEIANSELKREFDNQFRNYFNSTLHSGKMNYLSFEFTIVNGNHSENDKLVLYYTFNEKPYVIIYYLNEVECIKLPIYTENNKRMYSIFQAYCYTDNKHIKITDFVKRYAGPMGNFYNNFGINVRVKDLCDYYGKPLIKENDILIIKDAFLKTYYFKINDTIKLF